VMSLSKKPDLSKLRIGISVSESADLYRLGFSEGHLRLALGEVARTVLVHGGSICYGGHLSPTGYTSYLVQELERYGDVNRPLLICLGWSEHATLSGDLLEKRASEYGLYAKIVYLDLNGAEVERTQSEPLSSAISEEERVRSLTGMRRYISKVCSGRVLLGGKLRDYQGALPGLLEEAILALEQGTPLFLAGGFGGATLEVLKAMDPVFSEWLPAHDETQWQPTREAQDALAKVHSLWTGDSRQEEQYKILDRESMRQLAGTYRPSEIATLVGKALVNLAGTNAD